MSDPLARLSGENLAFWWLDSLWEARLFRSTSDLCDSG